MREIFTSLIGNRETKSRLSRAVLRGTLPHAFLFVGARGSGKRTLALELSASLNCERRDNDAFPLPCRSCNTCRRIWANSFADIHYVRRDGKKMSIGVDEIHKMQEDIVLSSAESEHRIYVIEEAEKLTPQAQNAMLKTLEEPPSGVVIMLLAEEADKILSTIKSRTQTVNMERFGTEALNEALISRSEKAARLNSTDPEALLGILMTAEGRLGQALAFFEDGKLAEEISERRAVTRALVSAFRTNAPYSELYLATKELPASRNEFREALEELLLAIRDLIVQRYDKNAPLLYFTSREEAEEISSSMNHKRLFSIYDLIRKTLEDNAKNANIGAQIANLAAKIKLI